MVLDFLSAHIAMELSMKTSSVDVIVTILFFPTFNGNIKRINRRDVTI